MSKVVLTRAGLDRAKELGMRMAREEFTIRPRLDDAGQYDTYHRFCMAHRAFWEHSAAFESKYQDSLYKIADKEASNNGLSEFDSITNWDYWYSRLVFPLRDLMWRTWEEQVGLERRYFAARLEGGKDKSASLQEWLRIGAEEAARKAQTYEGVTLEQEKPSTMSALFGWLRGKSAAYPQSAPLQS